MALPRWLARFNKRTFNKMEIRRGKRPVLIHIGRESGREYRTPLDAHPTDGGYTFIPNYGPDSDWVRNILDAGEARLLIDSTEMTLTGPRLVPAADSGLPDEGLRIVKRLKLESILCMDRS